MIYLKAKILIWNYFIIVIDSFSNSIINRCEILLNLIIWNFFSNCNNLWIHWFLKILILDLINAHTFSIGFKFGEYGGQSITIISLSLLNCNASNDQWNLQLSICCTTWSIFDISLNSSKLLCNIPIYFSVLRFSSKFWRVSFSFVEITLQILNFYPLHFCYLYLI